MRQGLLLTVIIGTIVVTPVETQADLEVKWFGFAQLTGEVRDQDDPNDGIEFDADRVRIGFKIKDDKIFGKLQVDFLQSSSRSSGNADLPGIIKDAEVGYKFSNAASIKVGQFKTPLGMDFNTSGKKLDITKRGMEKGLVLERAVGLMLSGRKMGGFGYDFGIFNPAVRSAADAQGTRGKDNAYVGRLMYDTKSFHVEGAYAVDETSIAGKSDYEVWDIAGSYKTGPWTLKGEYISGDKVDGDPNREEEVWYVHGGYKFSNNRYEALVRFYRGEHDNAGVTTDLTNTFVGMTFFLGTKLNGRLQVNYVFAGGDTGGAYKGQRGYKDDALLTQFQFSF